MRPSPRRPGLAASCLAPLLVLLALLGSPPSAAAVASPWNENPHSRVRLVSPYRVAPASGELWLGLHFRLSEGWHVYWKNSGDAGFPPAIDASRTPELGKVELLFPAPERYELPGGLVAFGYDHEVVYPVRATVAAPGEELLEVTITLDYLVCKVDCVPYRYDLRLVQPLAGHGVGEPSGPETDSETAALLDAWRERLPRPVSELPGVTTDAVLDVSDLERPALVVTLAGAQPAPGRTPDLFLEHHELFGADAPVLEQIGDGLRFRVPLELRRRLEEAPLTTAFAWTVTGLNEPEAVEARRAVPARLGAPSEARPGRAGDAAPELPGTVLAAFAGGLLLALTPGALSLLLGFLAGFGTLGSRAEKLTLTLGASACAGAVAGALSLALFGLASAPGGGGAAAIAAGDHLDEPTALAALALVSLGLALWFWGLLGDAEGRLSRRGLGPGPAAVAGLLAPVLALAWPVPPAPAALARAAAGGPGPTLLAAAALGLGLGLPWIGGALLISRAGRSAPESVRQATSERTRQALGFVAALTILWLLYLLAASVRTEYLAFVELALLATALVAWLRRRSLEKGNRVVRAVLTVALLAAAVATVWLADRGRLRARPGAPEDAPRRAETQATPATVSARAPDVG